MKPILVAAMIATVLILGLWLASKQRSKKQSTMTGRDWQTKASAYRWDERSRGMKVE